MPMNAAPDVIASLRWCQASVLTAVLPAASPARATNRNSISLATTTTTSTISVNGAGAWWGVRISRTLSTAIRMAAPISTSDTTHATSGSALPCP